jgi:hypothetical protein
MKIRIKGNSLRLRLVRSEVSRLAEEGTVSEATHFAPGRALTYSLEASAEVEGIVARYEQDRIRVLLPWETIIQWATTDQVSLVADQDLGSGLTLKLLVEKDFTCINPRSVWQEDQSDNFDNPNPSCGHS